MPVCDIVWGAKRKGEPSVTPWTPGPLLPESRTQGSIPDPWISKERPCRGREHTYQSFPLLITSFCHQNSLQTIRIMCLSCHVPLTSWSQLPGPEVDT